MRISRRWLLVLLPLGLWVLGPESALSSGVRSVDDSWLLGPQPSGRRIWALALAQGQLFSQPDLPQQSLSLKFSPRMWRRKIRLEARWERLGADLFQEDQWRGELMVGSRLGVGMVLLGRSQQIASEVVVQGWEPLLVVQISSQDRVLPFWRVKMEFATGAPSAVGFEEARKSWLHLEFWQARWALGIQLDRRPGGAPVPGMELLWQIPLGVGLCLRMDPASGALGPGVRLRKGVLLIRTSHLMHPSLGQTHRLGLVVSPHE